MAEWIRERTALHALPESREALRVAWKRYLAAGQGPSAEGPLLDGPRWNDAAPEEDE